MSVNSIFAPNSFTYLQYPDTRKVLNSVLKDKKAFEKTSSDSYKLLENLIAQDVNTIKKSSKIYITILKIKTILFCKKKKRDEALQIIQTCIAIIISANRAPISAPVRESSSESTSHTDDPQPVSTPSVCTASDFIANLSQFKSDHEFSKLIIPSKIELIESYEHYELCDKLAEISKDLKDSSFKIKKNWEDHLKNLHNTPVIYSDNLERRLKTKIALSLLKQESLQFVVEKLTTKEEKDILQIAKVEKEAFCAFELHDSVVYDEQKHLQRVRNVIHSKVFFYVVRDTRNGKIVGALEYHDNFSNIYSIARRAMYSNCRVGSLLWKSFSEDLKQSGESKTIKLYVRTSNPAIEAYKKWGFKKVRTHASFYQQPEEDAVIMNATFS